MSSNYDIKCKVMEEELRSVWPEWHVDDCLGGSTSSDVFRIYRDNFGIRVESALKVIQVRSEEAAAALPSSGQEAGEAESGETEAASQSDIPDALLSEIQIMEALRGAPNIVAIEDYFFKREGSTCSLFVRMELLTSLQEVLSGRDEHGIQSSIREIIRLGREICTALMHCEKKGIIHRDIKPENLFVDEFGHYKAGDFGTSKRMDTGHIARTMTGIGTISYMAPEIFQGRSCSNTADIYSLGLVLYQLLNKGRMPFLPAEGSYTTQDIDNANFQRLHGISVPGLTGNYVGGERINSRLDAVVRKACASDPADRYQTAKEFYDALEQAETEENKHTPVYRKKTQGSLAPAESLQNRQQERLQPEPGIKPSADLEPAVSILSVLEEKERLKSEIKESTSPPAGRTSKSVLEERERLKSEKKESTSPPPDRSSQNLPQAKRISWPEEKRAAAPPKEERRSGRNNQSMIIFVILLIIAVAALAVYDRVRIIPGPISDSWEEIIAAGEDGTYIDKYKIGDTKELDLGEEGVINMELVAFDADELADGSGKAHMTWISKDLLNTKRAMNEERTNEGGWPATDMRAWLRDSVFPLFPDTVQSNIKEVKKYSFSFIYFKTISSTDTIWIPSMREIYGADNAHEKEGPEYIMAFTNHASRQKKHKGAPGTWWLRSACESDSLSFNIADVDESNTNFTNADYEFGIAIGFCF